MRNDGKDAEGAFLARMKRPGVVIERFWDQADLRGLNRGRTVTDYPKPSDFLVTQDGAIHYAEVKSVQCDRRFPFKNIKDGQRSAALRQAAAGGPYRFYIFSFGLGEWFVMEARQFAEAIARGAKSILFEELTPWTT
jgi:penicillin-binding protein-related factor A (putative recombinase)